ncbi:hypothetical protein [Paractinoplanes globisporus]|uniref:Uncharacterized protein n=1 Tax=Paractinoplanes globisporus TaxID=113565 RepID=A0ABW6WKT0_9ACTN|nr:hypothetical protein [Actinoplanes globisporus]
MAALVEQWHNRKWGIARRKIDLLRTPTGWQVRGRRGSSDDREVIHYFDNEDDARAMVDAMKQAVPPQLATWAKVTDREPPPAAPRH